MSSGLTFTQGLLVGQLSVVFLIGAFIKFFIFGEAPPLPAKTANRISKHTRTLSLHSLASSQSSPPHSLRNKPSASNVLRAVPTTATDTASILRKTYYQMGNRGHGKNAHSAHQPESLDWFNVLIAQTIAQYRQTAYSLKDASTSGKPSILSSLEASLNDPEKRPSFIDTIKITEISMGEEFPIFSNVRVIAVEDESSPAGGSRLQALLDVDLSDDNLTMAIETSLILNYPKPFSAILPVALAVSVVRFSGTLSISLVPAISDAPAGSEGAQTSSSKPKTNLAFSFLPDYRLDLSVRSLIGSRSRLQDVPKIAQLVEARVQAWFEERVVEPRVQVVPLPGLWPRMGKTRVREGQEEDLSAAAQDVPKLNLGNEGSTSKGHMSNDPDSDGFPSQEEAEALIQGLRRRAPKHDVSQPAIISDDEVRMPGALPA